jgi:hypothetical protein
MVVQLFSKVAQHWGWLCKQLVNFNLHQSCLISVAERVLQLYSYVKRIFAFFQKGEVLLAAEKQVGARLASSACPSAPVHKGVYMSNTEVDNDINIIDVKTASRHVGSNENAFAIF